MSTPAKLVALETASGIRQFISITGPGAEVWACEYARGLGATLCLTAGDQSFIETATSELCRYLLTHGDRGVLLIETLSNTNQEGVAITAQMHWPDRDADAASDAEQLADVLSFMDVFKITTVGRAGSAVRVEKWCQGEASR